MPRKSPRGKEQLEEPTPMLMLPPVRTAHKHDREVDAYKTLVGAVPGHVANEKVIRQNPIERDLTEAERAQQLRLRNEAAEKGQRYNAWLDALIEHGGDKITALAQVYGIEPSEARIRQYELEAHVREGMGASDVGELLDRNNISTAAQARILSNHAYSDNPAASLSAIKIIQEMQGDTNDVGSFESFLRLSKLSGKGIA
jgi:hypothetical protein